jgi:hypothetical protein
MITKQDQIKNFDKDNDKSNSIFNIYHAFFYTNKIFSNNKQSSSNSLFNNVI